MLPFTKIKNTIMEKTTQENLTPYEIGGTINKISGVNIYGNTRSRKVVEHRALMCYLLRDKLNIRWRYIAEFFNDQGKHMDHSTAIHAVKMYPLYRRHNKSLADIEGRFVFTKKGSGKEINKMTYLENKYDRLESKYLELKDQLDTPLLGLVLNAPPSRTNELYDRVKMQVDSWKWKEREGVK
tara:strand:- start:915 stop:1463 length:549 start_codon:yes stop_codon:yes gene_type:complete